MKLYELWMQYEASPQYERLAPKTKRLYWNGWMGLLSYRWATQDIKKIKRPDVIDIRDHFYNMPGKCRITLAVLNNLLKFAYARGWVEYNHAARIGDLPPLKEIQRWEEWEVDLFLQTAPDYLKDVMMMALYTGQRRSDLAEMKWADYDSRFIFVRQRKTGKELYVPVHPKLRMRLVEIRIRSQKHRTVPFILLNHFGQKWVPDTIRNSINRHNAKVGIVGKSIHGVRKTTASLLAEMGCSPAQIMSITGHSTLKEVTRYTAGADQKRLAEEAMTRWTHANEDYPTGP